MGSALQQGLNGGSKPQKAAKSVIPFGKYLLLERISVGGMAELFRAKAFGVDGFERIIAIKRILPTMAEDEEFIEMFVDEAKIVGQLSHSNIVPIYELGRIGDSHFIAMEFVWGKDLLQIMNRNRRLHQHMPGPMAAFIGSRICEGLDYAHRKKDTEGRSLEIIHRDVSPQNVIASYEGEVKLIDFGIAKAASRQTRTQAGVLKGKFGYMSPEQVRGLPLDRRSDIFAVGTCLYEMLTSERLFLGESDFSTLEKVRNADVAPLSSFNSAVPRELERIIMKALSRDAEDRYQWASEMQEALQRYLLSAKPVFGPQKLAQFMKTTFSAERETEKERMDEQVRVGRDKLPAPPAPEAASTAPPQPPLVERESSPEPTDRRAIPDFLPDAEDLGVEVRLELQSDESLHAQPTQIAPEGVAPREIAAAPTTIFFANEEALLASPNLAQSPSELPALPTVILTEDLETLRPAEEVNSVRVRVLPAAALSPLEKPMVVVPGSASAMVAPYPPAGQAGLRTMIVLLALTTLGLAAFLLFDRMDAASPRQRVATLVVASRPIAEADVLIDGQARGRTPLKIDGIDPGIYRITVTASGYRPHDQQVEVHEGTVELHVGVLEPVAAQGSLRLIVGAAASRVLVDGAEVPRETLGAPLPLGAGLHHVEVESAGLQPQSFDLTIAPGATVTREITLGEPAGSVAIESTPSGAAIVLDGAQKGRTPLTVERLGFGLHHVSLSLEGYRVLTQEVSLTREAPVVRMSPVLEPMSGGIVRDAPAERRATPEGGEYGTLIIATVPIARVLVDGVDTGRTTPIVPNNPLRLRPGSHRVTFRLSSGQTRNYPAVIRAGEQTRLTGIRLSELP